MTEELNSSEPKASWSIRQSAGWWRRGKERVLRHQTPMCPSGKHICLSLPLWQAISWWASLHDEWSPFHSFIVPLNHALTCFGDQFEAAFLYLAGLEGSGDFFKRGSAPPDHRRNFIFAVFFVRFYILVEPHWQSCVFPWVRCIVWLSYLSTFVDHQVFILII